MGRGMAKLILFGGGDAGGILITPNGVKPIPPFDPLLRLRLRGLSLLLHGSTSLDANAHRESEGLTTKVSHILVNDLQDVAGVGSLEGANTVVYWDVDGGFTCGSTGKPFPFPPKGNRVDPRLDPRATEVAMSERVTVRN